MQGPTLPLVLFIPHVHSFSGLFSENRTEAINIYFEVWESQVMVLSERLKGDSFFLFS